MYNVMACSFSTPLLAVNDAKLPKEASFAMGGCDQSKVVAAT